MCDCKQTQIIPTHFVDTSTLHLQKISHVVPRGREVRNVAGAYVTRVYVTRVVYIIKRLVHYINI